ncbi:uncharacterized protein BXZ73DRAFT_105273 [Epithele typhae]|uniref:uncharacterized protein n=1 Tax=Epithele typhae TaxID=378194 RepID=UPI002007CE2E|nr:uncharacterized protein BXZ73DRAFT_105273 [Epithele typhae]KAH9918395.1 hypothetical protein BXZ73DRAFT_105273 [Epithele typhae]
MIRMNPVITLPPNEYLHRHLAEFVAFHLVTLREIAVATAVNCGPPDVIFDEPHLIVVELAYCNLPFQPARVPNPARTFLVRTAFPVHVSSPAVASNPALVRQCTDAHSGLHSLPRPDVAGVIPVLYSALPVDGRIHIHCPAQIERVPIPRAAWTRSVEARRAALARSVRYIEMGVVARAAPPVAPDGTLIHRVLGFMVRMPVGLAGGVPDGVAPDRRWAWRPFWRDGDEEAGEWARGNWAERYALLARLMEEVEPRTESGSEPGSSAGSEEVGSVEDAYADIELVDGELGLDLSVIRYHRSI